MQKKIQNLVNGIFTYEEPILSFSVEKLELEVLENTKYRGSFSIKSTNELVMKGTVYSSNARMVCENPDFIGQEAEIFFEFYSNGFQEGEIQKGKFSVICNGGEYYLSFVIVITADYPISSLGKIKNLFDFTNLARESLKEAFEVFQSKAFYNLIKKQGQREQLLYEGFHTKPAAMQHMEEFLCELKKKGQVRFSLEETELLTLTNQGRLVQECLNIRKHQWGHLFLELKTDAAAVSFPRQSMSSQDFVGNIGSMAFMIDGKKLHAGRNYIQIMIESSYQREICQLCVNKPSVNKRSKNRTLLKRTKLGMTKDFIAFSLGLIFPSEFKERAGAKLKKLIELEPDQRQYRLLRAYLFLINKQRWEAESILKLFAGEAALCEQASILYAYYLYLTTLVNQESTYVSETMEQIKAIYKEHLTDPILAFIVLSFELQQNPKSEFDLMEETILSGCFSPIIYSRVFKQLKSAPYLFAKPGKLERQVLYWLMKSNMLTKEIAAQVKTLLSRMKGFHPVWYRISTSCYELFPSRDFLQTICSYCIKWQCYGREYFKWYQEGVRAEFKLAGLFEAWFYSARQEHLQKIPKSVILYFQYHNNLSYKQQARLYAALLQGNELHKIQYKELLNEVQLFTIEQLRCSRVDENLAVLYEELIYKEMLDEKMAGALSEILFCNKIYCSDKRAVRVIVLHKQLKEEQCVPLVNQSAYIFLYSNSYCILMEDAWGRRFAANYSWELQRLMQPSHYMKKCMELMPNETSLLIFYFDGKGTWKTFQEEDVMRLAVLLNSELISEGYKNELKAQMIEYCYWTYTGEQLDNYLLTMEYHGLDTAMKKRMLELLSARGLYEKAYQTLFTYGTGGLSYRKLVSVVTYQIEKIDYAFDAALVGLSDQIFQNARYNESIIRYMCMHYEGPIKELAVLWEAAQEYEMNTYTLEDKFLRQFLYTTDFVLNTEEIFNSYCAAKGDEQLIYAFLAYFSHQYFVKEALLSDDIFYRLEFYYRENKLSSEICRLAYFKWLSSLYELSLVQEEAVYELMDEFMLKGMRFAFYTKFPASIQHKYHLYDKVFLEYRTNPEHHVQIVFRFLEDAGMAYSSEDMSQMFEGIFVKEFTVFYGEVIYYYIREEKSSRPEESQRIEITRSDCLEIRDLYSGENDESCYDLINGMMISLSMQDDHTLLALLEHYLKMEDITDQIFHPL